MFSLIPWKKRNNGGSVKVWREPSEEFFPLSRIRDEFDELWDRLLGGWERGLRLWDEDFQFGLRSGLEDTEKEYVFHADLPGFEPSDIEVKVCGDRLEVRAEKKQEKQGADVSSYRSASFHRCFTLPYGVDEQKIDARYHNGVLEVHLPKTEEAKGKRIPVITG